MNSPRHLKYFYTHAKDIPFYNWAQFHDYDRDNVKHLMHTPTKECKVCAQLSIDSINKSIINVYGYPDNYIRRIQALSEIREKEIEYLISGNKMKLTEAKTLAMLNANDIKISNEHYKFWEVIIRLSSNIKIQLDARVETVLNIYDRCMVYAKEQQMIQEHGRRHTQTIDGRG